MSVAACKDRENRSVVVCAGLDSKQVEAAWTLHLAWALEEGYELNAEIWMRHMKGLVTGGRYNLWVAWDGDTPVGCAECHLFYDARTSYLCGQGERTYILPGYRNAKVFADIYESGLLALDWLGVKVQRAVVSHDTTGRFLQRWHEAHGLTATETIMQRIVEDK